jgi:hypothetical protein
MAKLEIAAVAGPSGHHVGQPISNACRLNPPGLSTGSRRAGHLARSWVILACGPRLSASAFRSAPGPKARRHQPLFLQPEAD